MGRPERLEIKAAGKEIVHGKPHGTMLLLYAPLEHKNGYVFLLAQISPSCKNSTKLASLLNESVERLRRQLDQRSHLQHRFEQSLQALNNDIAELVEEGDLNISHLQSVLGVLRDDTFILSGGGKMSVLFLRKTAKQHVRFYDLMHNLNSESGSVKIGKFFGTVLDGTLQSDDVLIIASGPFSQYINLEESHPLFTTLPPTSTLETIETQFPARAHIGVLVFQAKAEKDVLTGYGHLLGAKESIRAFEDTASDTEAMLSLEKPHFQESFSKVVQLVRSGSNSERLDAIKKIFIRIWKILRIIAVYIIHILSNVAVSAWSLFTALVNRGSTRKRALHHAMSAWSRTWKSGSKSISKLSILNKASMVGILVIIVVLVGTIFGLKARKSHNIAEEAFAGTIAQVDERLNAADASLIYSDIPAARRAINEAETSLNTLELNKQRYVDQAAERELRIAGLYEQVRLVIQPEFTRISIPTNDGFSTNGKVVMHSNGVISRIDQSSLLSSNVANPNSVSPKASTAFNNDIVFTTQEKSLARYRSDQGSIQSVGINAVENELVNAHDLLHYGERLYVLVPVDNQIYRHQLIEDQDYGPGTAWLKDPVDFSQATAITIDGTLWVSDGATIRHFDQGTEVGFPQEIIDPPLQSVTDLWTDNDSSLLFVLEALGDRLVVLDKETNALLGQYVDPALRSARGLSIDVNNRTAYVVTQSELLIFPLTSVMQ